MSVSLDWSWGTIILSGSDSRCACDSIASSFLVFDSCIVTFLDFGIYSIFGTLFVLSAILRKNTTTFM